MAGISDAQWRRLTESSDLLLPDVAEQMRERGPRAVVVEVKGCGHAPALNTPEQFAWVERFLAARAAAFDTRDRCCRAACRWLTPSTARSAFDP